MIFRTTFLALLLSLLSTLALAGEGGFTTEWRVNSARGLDALLLVGAAGGDVMQAEIYGDDIAWVRDHVSEEGLRAIDMLDKRLRQEMGLLTGPSMVYFFSAGPMDTIDDVIASAADPVGRLKPTLQLSPTWDPQQFESALDMMPDVNKALVGLRDAGFEQWYANTHLPDIESAVDKNYAAVSEFDIIPEQERLLGRKLDPGINLIIASFTRPYGIRIIGQSFIAWYGWKPETQLRVAAHEIFHPPFDPNDAELQSLLEPLKADPWINSIVDNHDPKFGYNSFDGVVDEGSTQALDQVVSERLGVAEDPAERWRDSDGGMHMLAAAIYDAMLEDGFAETGGSYSDWLKTALIKGLLSPERVRARAEKVVDAATVDQWDPSHFE